MPSLIPIRHDLQAIPLPANVKQGVFTHAHTFNEFRDFYPKKPMHGDIRQVTLVVGATGFRPMTRAEALRMIETGV